MLIVGLTGGIGSGKTTVSELFANLGVSVIDTDVIARQLVEPGQPAFMQVVETFGKQVLNTKGQLDRDRLRELVFADNEKRLTLEAILHPLIKQAALDHIHQLHDAYCVLVVPLLVEKGWRNIVDRVLVVDTTETLQRQRVKLRNGLTDDKINAIMRHQATRDQRLAQADDVIINNDSFPYVEMQVQKLHLKYQELARTSLES